MSNIPQRAKEMTLGAATVGAGVVNAYFWKTALFSGEIGPLAAYSLPVASLLAFAVLFALSAAFIREPMLRTATAILSTASGFLLVPYQPTVLPGVGLAAGGSWYAAGQMANEYAVSSYFSARKILRGGLPIFFTAVALLLALFYFASITAGGAPVERSLLPRAFFDIVVPLFERSLQDVLPGFRSDASVDELILAFAAGQINGGIDPAELPPAEQEELLHEGRVALSRELGVPVSGGEKGIDVLYDAANAQIAKFAGPYRDYLPFLAAAGFFVAVKTFTLPIYWLTLLLVAGVVKLLTATHVLKREAVIMQVEKIHL